MKLNNFCEATGLTDRAIRFYMDQCLIHPTQHLGYLGRKSYDFSEDDVERRKEITIFRRFDFSVDEIRTIILEPSQIFHSASRTV